MVEVVEAGVQARRSQKKAWAVANPVAVAKFKRDHYRRRKLKAMAFLGNKCADCGVAYDGTNAPIFEFDHINPVDKEVGITRIMSNYAWEKALLELAKCQLLCANCHNLKHGGTW